METDHLDSNPQILPWTMLVKLIFSELYIIFGKLGKDLLLHLVDRKKILYNVCGFFFPLFLSIYFQCIEHKTVFETLMKTIYHL